ncbi:MAG: EXORDIUM family protein [Acidobacteriota bacterium]|nr:EXORDIUM family protein [Acidobacteriota bacterium]
MKSRSLKYTLALTCGLLAAAAANAGTVTQSGDMVPTGKGWAVHSVKGGQVPQGGITNSTGIFYHGGPVMLGTNHVYYIWYGNWGGNSAINILQDLANTMGGTPYWNIETTYTQSGGGRVSNSLRFGGSSFDSYSQGSAVDDNGIANIVANALNTGALPLDSTGVYLVLTSADVNETTGFCTQYCGWHTAGTFGTTDVKYGFIGNTDACPSACTGFPGNAPNGNAGADGMASIIAHELDEAVSDPDLNAWFDNSGAENGDKCAYNYGTTSGSSGARWNVTFGSRHFLVQRNWKNSGTGGCTIHFP